MFQRATPAFQVFNETDLGIVGTVFNTAGPLNLWFYPGFNRDLRRYRNFHVNLRCTATGAGSLVFTGQQLFTDLTQSAYIGWTSTQLYAAGANEYNAWWNQFSQTENYQDLGGVSSALMTNRVLGPWWGMALLFTPDVAMGDCTVNGFELTAVTD